MKPPKSFAGCMIAGGLLAVIIFGQLAAWASGHVGDPRDDWYYDCFGWIGTIGAFAGIAAFGWGAKLFSEK